VVARAGRARRMRRLKHPTAAGCGVAAGARMTR
jgi:hypothetical protein